MCWKRVLVHSLAGKHFSPLAWQQTVQLQTKFHFICHEMFLKLLRNLICKGKDLCVIEFVTGGQEQDWRPRRLHCLLLLPPLACRTLQDFSLVLIKYKKLEVSGPSAPGPDF